MSKQSEAKKAQNYVKKAPNCGDCRNMKFDMILPAWMRGDTYYDNDASGDAYKRQKNLRCGIGGFAIQKSAVCCQHQPKEAA